MNFGVGQLVRKPNSGGGVRANGSQETPSVKPSPPAPVTMSEAPSDVPSNDDIAPPPPAFDSSPGTMN